MRDGCWSELIIFILIIFIGLGREELKWDIGYCGAVRVGDVDSCGSYLLWCRVCSDSVGETWWLIWIIICTLTCVRKNIYCFFCRTVRIRIVSEMKDCGCTIVIYGGFIAVCSGSIFAIVYIRICFSKMVQCCLQSDEFLSKDFFLLDTGVGSHHITHGTKEQ